MVDKDAIEQVFVRRHCQLPSPTSIHKPYALPLFHHRRHQLLRRWEHYLSYFIRRGKYPRLHHRIPALCASLCLDRSPPRWVRV
jgi:hypothetical protein